MATIIAILKVFITVVPTIALIIAIRQQNKPPRRTDGKFKPRIKWQYIAAIAVGVIGVIEVGAEAIKGVYDSAEAARKQSGLESSLNSIKGIETGGDTICYWMLYQFDLKQNAAHSFALIRLGKNPLYDVRIRVYNMDANAEVFQIQRPELDDPADFALMNWHLPASVYYRIYVFARNGSWDQDLILKRSSSDDCWLAATQVKTSDGHVAFKHLDNDFIKKFGQPAWRE